MTLLCMGVDDRNSKSLLKKATIWLDVQLLMSEPDAPIGPSPKSGRQQKKQATKGDDPN